MSSYNLGTASGRIEIDGTAGAAGFKAVETAADTFFGVIQNKVDSIEQMGRRMAVAGAAGVAGFGVAINAASDFETQMSGVRAVAGGTEEEFEALRQAALRLGADTSFSASEAALAIEELAKAGIPIEDILNGAADGAVALAAAGGVSLAQAATIAGNAMNAFGLEASDMTDVADTLAGVANVSAADVSSLGQSLSQAGAVANLAGMSFEDTAIALGQLSDAGINGSDAGTSLKTMLNNLIPVTDRQVSKFKDLGLLTWNSENAMTALRANGVEPLSSSQKDLEKQLAQLGAEMSNSEVGSAKQIAATQKLAMETGALDNAFFDAKGNLKDLGDLQGVLAGALQGMTREQKLATLEVLFGADAMRATAILAENGAKGYEEFAAAMEGTSAAEVAATRLDNLSGAVEEFGGSMETAMITIGSVFLPAVTALVNGATAVVNVFNSLPKPIQTAIAVIIGIVSVIALLVGTLMASMTAIAAFVVQWYTLKVIAIVTGYLKTFITLQRTGIGVMAAHSAAMSAAAAKTTLLGRMTLFASKMMVLFARSVRAAWLAMLGPIGIAIAVIAGLVALGMVLYERWAPFRNLVNSIGAALKGAFLSAMAALRPIIVSLIAAFMQFGNYVRANLMPVLQQVGSFLMGTLAAAWTSIVNTVRSQLLPALQQLGAAFQGQIVPAAQRLWTVIQPLVLALGRLAMAVGGFLLQALMKLGQVFITHVLPALIKVGGFLGGVLINTIKNIINAITQVVTGIIQVLTGLVNFVAGVLTGNWARAWQGIKQIFTGVLNAIVGAVKLIWNVGILKAFRVGFTLVAAIVRGGWRLIVSLFRSVGPALGGVIRAVWNTIVGIVRSGMQLIGTVIRGAWNLVRSIFSAAVNGLVNVVRGGFSNIGSNIRTAASNIVSILRSAWSNILSAARTAFSNLVSAVQSGVSNMMGIIQGIPGQVTSALGNLGSLLYSAGASLISGLVSGIRSQLGAVSSAVGEVASRVRGFFPGSPVKEGPLTSWNRGGAGKRLVDMLADGLKDQDPVEEAAKSLASYVNGMNLAMTPVVMADATVTTNPATTRRIGQALSPTVAKNGGKGGAADVAGGRILRPIEGKFTIDKNGVAWFRGIAEEVVDSEGESQARMRRMRNRA